MAPVVFFQFLFEECHLLFGRELIRGNLLSRRRRRGWRRRRRIGLDCLLGWISRLVCHGDGTVPDPPAFFQSTYNRSTFVLAHGVFRRNVRLDLMLGSKRKQRTGTCRPSSSQPNWATSSVRIFSSVTPCSRSWERADCTGQLSLQRSGLQCSARVCPLRETPIASALPAAADLPAANGVRRGMKRIARAAGLLIGLGILVTGCATLSPEAGVAVSLVSIRPLQASLFETSAELTLRFTNESTRALALTGSTHRLYLNGTYIGRAVTNERLAIPQLGTMTQTITAHLENLALMKKAQELGNVVAVDYRIDSRLHAADEQGGGTLSATSTGQLDLSGFMTSGSSAPPRAQ
jgi:hypothetical protein